jgi:16S rRNA processing protein RimM
VDVVVGRIGRAPGVRGEVTVEVRTDDPDRRFAAGRSLETDPAERGPLTVVSSRPHSGRLLVVFEGVADRDAAESLRGTLLTVDSSDSQPLDDPDEFYDHELVGLTVLLADGRRLGTVAEILHGLGGDLLVVRADDESERLVPFVRAIVPTVDVPAGRVVLDPPPGLMEL